MKIRDFDHCKVSNVNNSASTPPSRKLLTGYALARHPRGA